MDYRILKKAAEENDPEAAYKEIGRELMRLEMKIDILTSGYDPIGVVTMVCAAIAAVCSVIKLFI